MGKIIKGEKYVFGEYRTPQTKINAQQKYNTDNKLPSHRWFIRGKKFKYVLFSNKQEEFYHLENGEKKVDAKEFPEQFSNLKKQLLTWKTKIAAEKRNELKEKIKQIKLKINK